MVNMRWAGVSAGLLRLLLGGCGDVGDACERPGAVPITAGLASHADEPSEVRCPGPPRHAP